MGGFFLVVYPNHLNVGVSATFEIAANPKNGLQWGAVISKWTRDVTLVTLALSDARFLQALVISLA